MIRWRDDPWVSWTITNWSDIVWAPARREKRDWRRHKALFCSLFSASCLSIRHVRFFGAPWFDEGNDLSHIDHPKFTGHTLHQYYKMRKHTRVAPNHYFPTLSPFVSLNQACPVVWNTMVLCRNDLWTRFIISNWPDIFWATRELRQSVKSDLGRSECVFTVLVLVESISDQCTMIDVTQGSFFDRMISVSKNGTCLIEKHEGRQCGEIAI